MAQIDYLLNDAYEKKVLNGDFVVGAADDANVEQLITLSKGHIRHSPLTGLGIIKYINSENDVNDISYDISIELQKNGYVLKLLYFDDSGEIIDIEYL